VSSGLGIDLDPLGPNPNDIGDGDSGPNGLLNFPALFYAALTPGGDLRIGGNFDTSLGSKPYTIEFFANQVCDQSGYGEGERFLGSVELKTSLGGQVSIDTTFSQAGVSKDQFITATTIDQDGSTSEFSRCVQALPGTALSANASKGATTLNTNDTQGFVVGDYIHINPGGENQEDNQVSGFGSLLLVAPLKYAHTAGEPVVIITKRLYMPLVVD